MGEVSDAAQPFRFSRPTSVRLVVPAMTEMEVCDVRNDSVDRKPSPDASVYSEAGV